MKLIYKNLKKTKLINNKCNIEKTIFEKEILPTEGTTDLIKKLIINKIDCANKI